MTIYPGSAFKSHRCPLFLASVTSAEEARVCVDAGVSILDAKNPRTGALGALEHNIVREIVETVRQSSKPALPVSATIGDLPLEPQLVSGAAGDMAACGVDYVKIGIGAEGDASAAIRALGCTDIGDARLVAVLFADQRPDFDLVCELSAAGFAGVMLDTAEKKSGGLRDVLSAQEIREFVSCSRDSGLLCGLAGSLKLEDISPLGAFQPDILGFRGALCLDSDRTFAIDESRIGAVRAALDALDCETATVTR
ncbi:MAG: (5-formylfuran-3-yl)methyl phosphate synthase [Filomicrobium sp.]